jgi:hypothetical protein
MAPAESGLLAGIPSSHLAGLVAGVAIVALARMIGPLRALPALLLFTGGLHLGLAAGHATSSPGLAALFALNGLAYLAALAWLPRRGGRLAAGLLLAATIAAYAYYTLSGREAPEPVGIVDKLAELIALGLIMLPTPDGRYRAFRGWLAASAATVAVTFLTSGLVWAAGLKDGTHTHTALAATCSPNHHEGPNMVLRPVPCSATPEQQAAAGRLVDETRVGIAPYQDVNVALAAGYRPEALSDGPSVHYTIHHASHQTWFDPRHPAALVYARTAHGPMLLGAMYSMPQTGQPGPDVGGELTPWHYHTNICIALPTLQLAGFSDAFGQCPAASARVSSPDLLHVWTAPNPSGPFGDLDPAWVRYLASQ